MGDNLVSDPHDAAIAIAHDVMRELRDVDLIVADAEKHRDAEIAFSYAAKIRRTRQVQGYALAKLLYEMNERWGTAFISDDDFTTYAAIRMNYSPNTIRRYLKVWTWVFVKPEHGPDRIKKLLGHELDAVYRLAAASKEGELTEEDWQEAERAPNKEALMEIRDRIRGKQTSSGSALKLMLDRDGTLRARKGESGYIPFGFLNVDEEDNDEIIAAAIERIVNSAGLFRR